MTNRRYKTAEERVQHMMSRKIRGSGAVVSAQDLPEGFDTRSFTKREQAAQYYVPGPLTKDEAVKRFEGREVNPEKRGEASGGKAYSYGLKGEQEGVFQAKGRSREVAQGMYDATTPEQRDKLLKASVALDAAEKDFHLYLRMFDNISKTFQGDQTDAEVALRANALRPWGGPDPRRDLMPPPADAVRVAELLDRGLTSGDITSRYPRMIEEGERTARHRLSRAETKKSEVGGDQRTAPSATELSSRVATLRENVLPDAGLDYTVDFLQKKTRTDGGATLRRASQRRAFPASPFNLFQ